MQSLRGSQFLPDLRVRKYETLDRIRDGLMHAPTMIIWGLNDPSAPVTLGYQLFEHIANAIPHTRFHVFNRSGHYVYREHPREFNNVVLNFIASTTA
jgi:pimeloyl-ACP methyl ester carboxylesterase